MEFWIMLKEAIDEEARGCWELLDINTEVVPSSFPLSSSFSSSLPALDRSGPRRTSTAR